MHGGVRGDVYCTIALKKHPEFTVSGLTLTTNLKVDFVTAILGGEVKTTVFGKDIYVPIPAVAKAGRLLTVEGLGIHNPRTGERGDLKFRVVLEMPDGARKLTKEHRLILKSMFAAAAAR